MSFHLNPIHSQPEYVEKTERIYIDPEQLMALKTKRKTFTMVPSVYEPPEEESFCKGQFSQKDTTDGSLMRSNTLSKTDKKVSKNSYETEQQVFPQQKIKLLEEVLDGQNIAPNVEFIWKLFPSTTKKQIMNFQEGDCIPFRGANEDRFLILSGEVRIIGLNEHQYKRKAGYLFFLSNQTSAKIKEIVALRSTKLLKIPSKIYHSLIKNYLYLKNSEKIKFIQFCPFLIWKNQLTEDLASNMDVKFTEKEETIYQANSTPDFVYFVKEGIVLLERNVKIMNPVVEDYELHYEKNEISEKDTILVVRKGMAFGIDGIIIKEFNSSTFSNFQIDQAVNVPDSAEKVLQPYSKEIQKSEKSDNQNPETSLQSKKVTRKNLRIYTAKTLGKCELYCLDRRVLETLFSISDISEDIYSKKTQIRPQELERMSIEYANMILNNIKTTNVQVPLKKKELILKIDSKTFPKSKSVALIEHRHNNNSQLKNRKLNLSPKAFLMKNKKVSFEANAKNDAEIRNQFYLNEEREKNELRSKIRVEREKEKLMRVKKANSQNMGEKRDNQEGYILPKIGAGPKDTIPIASKKQATRQKLKLEEIIGMRLKQSMNSYSKVPQLSKNPSIVINNQYTSKESELSKLIEQSKDSRSNPSFINIKSYKSIISVYESVNNR